MKFPQFTFAKRALHSLRDAKEELEKVEWPSTKKAWHYSAVVLATIVILGAFFTALDFGLTEAIKPFID